jgi:uncharacterized repeat protein (TIGR03803 family)
MVASALILFCLVSRTSAQITILHNFADGSVPNDGGYPEAGLIEAPNGNFFGVTPRAFPRKGGVVFQITTAGTVTVITTFGKELGSYYPLFYYKKELIGVRQGLLQRRDGDIFAVRGYPSGPWVLDDWHVFKGGPNDGNFPTCGLVAGSDGNLFGMTSAGGTANQGTIYKVDMASHKVSLVYSFAGQTPAAPLFLANDGNLYGGTVGEIFKLTPSGGVTTFYQFSGGQWAMALSQGRDGNFYGIGVNPYPSPEFVFQLTQAGVISVLYNFTTQVDARGVIQGPNGNLYGVTRYGGSADDGTVFELSTDGSSFNILHNFGDGSVPNDGKNPVGTLAVGTDGNLYGVTGVGGSAGYGTVYRISP